MANLQSSGAISLNDLKNFFGGPASPSLSNYYRGGGYTPASYAVSTYESQGPYYSIYTDTEYFWNKAVLSNIKTAVYWGSTWNGTSRTPAVYTSSTEYTSITAGDGWTYVRGSSVQFNSLLGYFYYISRNRYVTTYPACNTSIPSSGTLALSHFYGAFKP